MDQEIFNMQLRKFLKNVGITSQREIETAVRLGIQEGKLSPENPISAKIKLTVEELGLEAEIKGTIKLQ